MLAFVDESGDPGRKIGQGSSEYFVVAIVTFEDHDEALECDRRIDTLRAELRLPPEYEFHYSHNSRRTREAFLEAVHGYEFFCHVFALNKDPRRLYGEGFNHKESLYKYTARLAFENAKPFLDNAIVVVDKSGDRKFRNELAAYLRQRIRSDDGSPMIKKVKIQRSSGNNLLQLADYVASISNRVLRRKQHDVALRARYLSAHELTNQVWPRQTQVRTSP